MQIETSKKKSYYSSAIRLAEMKTFESTLCWLRHKDDYSLIPCWLVCTLLLSSWRAFSFMPHDFKSHVLWPSNLTSRNLSYRYIHKYISA